jgi:uncharacterized membrane protein
VKQTAWNDSDGIFTEQRLPDRVLRLAIPFLFLVLHLLALSMAFGNGMMFAIVALMLAYELPPAGKETIIPLGILLGYPWWAVAGSIALVDLEVGLFMVWNFDLAERMPVLGPWITRFIHGGREFLGDRPWLSRLTFFGIAILVMVPVLGSGGVRGSIVGRLLGMGRLTVMAAIACGTVIGSFGIALGTLYLRQAFLQSLYLGGAILLGVIAAGVLVYWLMQRSSGESKSG